MPKLVLSKVSTSAVSEIRNATSSLASVNESILYSQNFQSVWLESLVKAGAPQRIIESAKIISTNNSEVIVTGQQLGFGITPVLSIYKMFFTEQLANSLSTKDKTIYPIFWMQSEDHDLKEVLDCNYAVSENTLVSALNKFHTNFYVENRKSIAALGAQEIVKDLWDSFEEQYLDNEFSALLKDVYDVPGETLASAFSKLYYRLFPESNLILFDINTPGLEALKSNTMRIALEKEVEIENIISETNAQLEKDGQSVPVNIKKNSPLFFYHPEGKSGPRYRLERVKSDVYKIHETNAQISKDELIQKIENSPEMFSSSALLRSFIQDSIFNTRAYVCGPAEVAYLRQISGLYPLFNITQPGRILRPSGAVIDDKIFGYFNSFERSFFSSYEELKENLYKQYITSYGGAEGLLSHIEENHLSKINSLLEDAISVDQTLKTPKDKTLSHMKKGLEKFIQKLKAAEVRKDEVVAQRIDKLLQQLFYYKEKTHTPYAQERVLSLAYFGFMYGADFIQDLRDQFFNQNVI